MIIAVWCNMQNVDVLIPLNKDWKLPFEAIDAGKEEHSVIVKNKYA